MKRHLPLLLTLAFNLLAVTGESVGKEITTGSSHTIYTGTLPTFIGATTDPVAGVHQVEP